MASPAQSVSQLVHDIKDLLEGNFQQVLVKGEVTNLSRSSTGHWYFTLSDPISSISCALFKMDAMRNPIINKVKEGDEITIAGSIGLYTKRGTFQVIARKVIVEGKGSLKEQFEKLKKKLAKEGLFDLDRKKPIPKFPNKVAIVTAPGAAALQDFLNVMMRRSFGFHLVLVPALVQGDAAPAAIIKALDKIKQVGDFDLVVVTRGGGSLEDLWAFNNESLARAISEIEIPVISAVGHQVDFTLSDFVSDLRCETPSAAAEVISQPQIELSKEVDHLYARMKPILPEIIATHKDSLQRFSPMQVWSIIQDQFVEMKKRLESCSLKNREFELIGTHEYHLQLDENITTLKKVMTEILVKYQHRINSKQDMLQALNPNNVLNRGYSYLSDNSGKVVDSMSMFDKLDNKEKLKVRFHDGVGNVQKV